MRRKLPNRLLDIEEQNPLRLYRTTRLAKLLGVDPSTISRWRKDGTLPPPIQIGGVKGWSQRQLEELMGACHDG